MHFKTPPERVLSAADSDLTVSLGGLPRFLLRGSSLATDDDDDERISVFTTNCCKRADE
jgi:hypothetical protein